MAHPGRRGSSRLGVVGVARGRALVGVARVALLPGACFGARATPRSAGPAHLLERSGRTLQVNGNPACQASHS